MARMCASTLQSAGADAVEVNFYHIATDVLEDGNVGGAQITERGRCVERNACGYR